MMQLGEINMHIIIDFLNFLNVNQTSPSAGKFKSYTRFAFQCHQKNKETKFYKSEFPALHPYACSMLMRNRTNRKKKVDGYNSKPSKVFSLYFHDS